MEDLKSWAMRIGTVIVAAALYVLSAALLKDTDAGPAVTLLAGALVGLLFPQIGKRAAMVAVLALGLSTTACAGSLEQSRAAGASDRKFGLAAAGAGTPERCATLSDRATLLGASAKFWAVAAGAAGVSTIPVDEEDKGLRTGLAIGSLAAAGIAAATVYASEATSATWARECSK